jgi:hypothetical protein
MVFASPAMERRSQKEGSVMMYQEARESVLVVVEGEAACPFWMDHWGDEPADGWTMLEQEPWEAVTSFSDRLEVALRRAAATGATVVLVAAGSTEALAMAARWQISSSIMNHLAACDGGRLLLTRGYGHDGRPDAALDALAEDLLEEWADADIDILVCLDEPAPVSNVRRAPRAPAQPHWHPAEAAQAF